MVTSAAAPNLSIGALTAPANQPNQPNQIANDPSTSAAAAAPTSGPTAPQALACTILTSSGSVIARAVALTRPRQSDSDQFEIVVTGVEPRGALEPIHHSGQQVVLRTPLEAQLALCIDAIVGPPERREFILQPPS